jgi:hypothetical protein
MDDPEIVPVVFCALPDKLGIVLFPEIVWLGQLPVTDMLDPATRPGVAVPVPPKDVDKGVVAVARFPRRFPPVLLTVTTPLEATTASPEN